MAYIPSQKNQNWLIPQTIRDMIPKDHICFLVEEFVESLNFNSFDKIYDGSGHPAYHPRILMKILIYGMLSKTRSSRKLARACFENFVFMYLSEKVRPDFRTISRFRKDNFDFIKNAFSDTVKLASKNNLIDLSFISIDGSVIKASAGKRRVVKKEGLDILDKTIDNMIKEDITLDEVEDKLYKDEQDGLTGMDRRDLKQIVRQYKNVKSAKTQVAKAKEELQKNNLKKISLTDPECRMMQNKKGLAETAYNVQLSVSKNQIVVANDVCRDGHDVHQFIPQVKNIRKNIDLKNTPVGVDCGYSDGVNIKFAEDNNINLYVPSRAQAQEFDGKKQSLNHDKYNYDWKTDEIIVKGMRLQFGHSYIRKNTDRNILVYYNKKHKLKKQVPEFF